MSGPETYALQPEQERALQEADPCVRRVTAGAVQLLNAWRCQRHDFEARFGAFVDLEQDLSDLIAHTEQLSAELERARPNAPAKRNAQEASRRAITRMYKVLAAQETSLQQLHATLVAGVEQTAAPVAELRDAIAKAQQYVASYKATTAGAEEEEPEPGAVPRDKGDRQERKRHKEKKEKARSKSPERRARAA